MAAVVLAVLVSGCLGLSGGEATPTPTVESPTPTPQATPTPTDTPSAEPTHPEGWSEAGIEDPNVALQSHYSAVLEGPSATVTYENRVLESAAAPGSNTTLGVALDPPAQRMHARIDAPANSLEAFYADGTLTQWDVASQSVRNRTELAYPRAVQSADIRILKSQLLLYDLEQTDTVQRDGTTVFVYNVTGVHNAASQTFGIARSGSGRVAVSADGRVRDIETTVTYTNGTLAYRYRHTDFGGTTVETPEWAKQG